MFHSQSLSTKGPLGSIWVAAYCHKRLKKAQVTATDIPFSVDKILQDEFEVITYRVLGYLLLGVVRIYSKKVEYLFNDCHKVLIQVKGFVVSEKSRQRASKSKVLDVPIGLITLPKRFELDAFDLEVGEDAGGAHEMPQEEITLKDNRWRYEGMDQYAIREYKWEDVAGRHDICSIDNTEAEDIIPLDYMDAETGEGNSVGLLTFEDNQSKSLNEDKQAEGEQMKNPEEAFLSEKDKCFSEEEHDLSNLVASVDRLQEDGEREIRNASLDAGDKCLVNEEEHDLSNLEYTIERLRESREFERGNQDFNVVAPLDGETRELVGAETEVNFIPEEANKPSETVSLESPQPDVAMKDQPISLRVDSTPPAKLPDTAEGGPTPEFMLIPTPTPKERPPTKRKRKSLFDDLIVLPNDLVKKSIRDASDLVCKRRKAPHDACTVWKATRALGFSEPLIPYSSSELRSLHCEKKLKMSVPCKDVEVPGKVKVSEPPSGDGSWEEAGIAPETPVRQFSSKRPFESPKASRSEEMRPESPSGSATLEKEPLAAESKRPFERPKASRSEEMRQESPSGSATLEKEPLAAKNHGLSPILMNEDFNSVEEATDKLYGWTGRTRTVARHLNEVFQNQKREGEAASLLQISKGRTRKECARLFYEILVLQCRQYIGVEQEAPYADVLIRKLPEWERAFDVNDPK